MKHSERCQSRGDTEANLLARRSPERSMPTHPRNEASELENSSLPGPFKVVAIGEVLWDIFPTGRQFGGAPANFACTFRGHAGRLAEVYLVSQVGCDPLGDAALDALRSHGVNTQYVPPVNSGSTGRVDVNVADDGCAVYEFPTETAWDQLRWSDRVQQLASEADLVCFGSLGQRSPTSRRTIARFLEATRRSCLRLFDVNLRPPFFNRELLVTSLHAANVLKLNDEELPVLADLCGAQGTIIEQCQQLADAFDLVSVALTKGSRGAVILRGSEVSDRKSVATNVVNTVGAGDAFAAAFGLGLLRGTSLDIINDVASRLAAFVCECEGANPKLDQTWDVSQATVSANGG